MAFRRLAKLLQGDTTERRPRPLDVRSTMPYKQITQLPDKDRAHRVAWSAVENKYEKNEKGNWVKKNS
jgi:ChaB